MKFLQMITITTRFIAAQRKVVWFANRGSTIHILCDHLHDGHTTRQVHSIQNIAAV